MMYYCIVGLQISLMLILHRICWIFFLSLFGIMIFLYPRFEKVKEILVYMRFDVPPKPKRKVTPHHKV